MHLVCPSCDTEFECLLATNRSKRARGNRKHNTREYDLRYFANGAEHFIQFSSDRYEDVELRSKDVFLLSKMGSKFIILQNLTVGQYWGLNQGNRLNIIE